MNEQDVRGRLGIPEDATVTFVQCNDEAPIPERKTGGWTDEQISRNSMSDIEELIRSQEVAVDALTNTLADAQNRLTDFRLIRQRKTQIGGA